MFVSEEEEYKNENLVTISGVSFSSPTKNSIAIIHRTICHKKAIPLRKFVVLVVVLVVVIEGVWKANNNYLISSIQTVSSPKSLSWVIFAS